VLILIHEMGHVAAMWYYGLSASPPIFIPFVGAWIQLKEQPMDVETEAYVASAGPLIGTLGALAIYYWGRTTHDSLLLAIAYGGFFLNFFNLIPLSPLDGGRMTAILTPRIWFVGLPILGAMMFYRPSPLLFVIAIAALPALREAWNYDPELPEHRAYYAAPASVRFEYGFFYLGLAAFLAIMTELTHKLIEAPTIG